MTQFTDDLIAEIDQQLTSLKSEIEQLEHARHALVDGAAPTRPERKPRARRNAQKAPAPAPTIAPAGKLLKLLEGAEGHTTASLAKASDAAVDQVRELLKELEKTGHVRRTGERRGTRWHRSSAS